MAPEAAWHSLEVERRERAHPGVIGEGAAEGGRASGLQTYDGVFREEERAGTEPDGALWRLQSDQRVRRG